MKNKFKCKPLFFIPIFIFLISIFTIKSLAIENGWYLIKCRSGHYIRYNRFENKFELTDRSMADEFEIECIDEVDRCYKISTYFPYTVLDGYRWEHNDGARVIGCDYYHGGDNQHWYFWILGGGWYRIQNKESQLNLDVRFSEYRNGTTIHQWHSNGTNAQQFYLVFIRGISNWMI